MIDSYKRTCKSDESWPTFTIPVLFLLLLFAMQNPSTTGFATYKVAKASEEAVDLIAQLEDALLEYGPLSEESTTITFGCSDGKDIIVASYDLTNYSREDIYAISIEQCASRIQWRGDLQ